MRCLSMSWKHTFIVAMCAEALRNVSRAAVLGPQRDRGKIAHIVCIEEHKANRGSLLVHLVWMTSQDDALRDNARGSNIQDGTGTHKVWSLLGTDPIVIVAKLLTFRAHA